MLMGQNRSSLVGTIRRSIQGMIRWVSFLFNMRNLTGWRGRPFSGSTKQNKNKRMNASTRCRKRGRQISSCLSYIPLVWRSMAVRSGPTRLRKLSSPPTLISLAREPKCLLVVDIFAAPTDISHHSINSKLGMASCGLPWLIYPDPRNAPWTI